MSTTLRVRSSNGSEYVFLDEAQAGDAAAWAALMAAIPVGAVTRSQVVVPAAPARTTVIVSGSAWDERVPRCPHMGEELRRQRQQDDRESRARHEQRARNLMRGRR